MPVFCRAWKCGSSWKLANNSWFFSYFWLFLLISSFLDLLTVFFVKNQLKWQLRDLNFVAIKIQSFVGVRFLKNSFINAVLKFCWPFFCKMFQFFVFISSAFSYFLFSSGNRSLYRMINYLLYVLNAEQWNVFVFLEFFNWFLAFKNQECVFGTVFSTLCPYSSHSSQYHSIFVLAPTFIFGILIFSVVKNKWFQLFLRFSSFLWFAFDFIQHRAVLRGW